MPISRRNRYKITREYEVDGLPMVTVSCELPAQYLLEGGVHLTYRRHGKIPVNSSVARAMAKDGLIPGNEAEAIDHKDGDTFNNDPRNLQGITLRANSAKMISSSPFPGVYLKRKKWTARAPKVGGSHNKFIGEFEHEHEAARAAHPYFQDHPGHLDYPHIPDTPGRRGTDERSKLHDASL